MTADHSPAHKSPPSYFLTGALGAMLRAPYPESPVLALLAMLFAFLTPRADIDGDGFAGRAERDHGCNPLDAGSFPVCADLDGDGIGEWPLIAPRCDLAEGLAPCA